jgi:hypothetical protein
MINASNLTTEQLFSLGHRLALRVEQRMTAPHMSGGLQYGWDWPTAGVLYPYLVGRFNELKREAKLRTAAAGLDNPSQLLSKG